MMPSAHELVLAGRYIANDLSAKVHYTWYSLMLGQKMTVYDLSAEVKMALRASSAVENLLSYSTLMLASNDMLYW